MGLRGLETRSRLRVRERFVREVVENYLAEAKASNSLPNPVQHLAQPLWNAGIQASNLDAVLRLLEPGTARSRRRIVFDANGAITGVERLRASKAPRGLPTCNELVRVLIHEL